MKNPQRYRHVENYATATWSRMRVATQRPQPGYPTNDPIQTGASGEFSYVASSWSCRDIVGAPGSDNDLDMPIISTDMGNLTYRYAYAEPGDEFTPITWDVELSGSIPEAPSFYGPLLSEIERDRLRFVTEAAAGVNPSAAKIDSAVFLAELRDLPSLFKLVGTHFMKYGANEYMKYQYGWKPLVKDLRMLFQVVNYVDKRLRNLERLRRQDKLRLPYKTKGHDIRTFSYVPDDGVLFELPHWNVMGRHRTDITVEKWAIVEMVPDIPDNLVTLPSRSDLDRVNQALYGGVVDGRTLWNIIPWSWLIDWVGNVDTFLTANRNVVGAKVSKVILMETMDAWSEGVVSEVVRNEILGSEVQYPDIRYRPAYRHERAKRRFVEYKPTLVVHTDGIDLIHGRDPFKTSILQALAIQRFKKPF